MTVTLVTVPGVEIVSTGTYQLASGETTFTENMLSDAVAASRDATVTAARLKLGHTDPRFADAIASGDLDGEPAFGVLSNLRLSPDRQTILGDYVNVPDWLADTLPSSYPGRSIEGGFNFTAASGRKYSLVITACALLGVTWPGVGSLEDLQEVLTANGQAPEALDADGGELQGGEVDGFVVARINRTAEPVTAATTTQAWDGSASRFTDQQYAASCILDRAKCSADWKDKPAKQRYSLPIKEPNGDLNANAVHAAAGRLSQTQACDAAKNAAKAKLRSAYSTLGETPPDSIAASGRLADVTAGMDIGDIRLQFLSDLDNDEVPQVPDSQPQSDDVGSQMWWWPRSIRVEDDGSLTIVADDDAGHLIQVPFTVKQGDLIYGDPQIVIEQYVPVTSDPDDGTPVAARAPQVIASWPTRAAGRPSTTITETTEVHTMRLNGADIDASPLRQRLGLADDATDTQIYEALGIPEQTEPEPEPVAAGAGAPQVPDGMRLIDEQTLAGLQEGAQSGRDVAARLDREERDRVVQAAIDDGKIPVGRRDHYASMWDRDQAGTRTLLTAPEADGGIAAGLIPTRGREHGQTSSDAGSSQLAEHEHLMASLFPNEHGRLAAKRGRGRVHQEV